MKSEILQGRNFEGELVFNATRSSGPGGQHINKVSTRIELRFDVLNSTLLNEYEKEVLLNQLPRKISKEGILIVVSQSERSQFDNKQKAIERFYSLLTKALTPIKKRRKTNPTAASKFKRLEDKQLKSKKKALRKTSIEE